VRISPQLHTQEVVMSSTEIRGRRQASGLDVGKTDMKLEVVIIPVSDVDRAKRFYIGLGWRLDADFADGAGFRIVQLTPPGSPCSIQFGTGITSLDPGSASNLYLVVSDIEAARNELVAGGAEVSPVFHEGSLGDRFHSDGRLSGPEPDLATYGSFATFSDPDGNGWLLQEITDRLPGRVDPGETAFASVAELASALRGAAAAHGEHEKRTGKADENWPDWYAASMAAEAGGTALPE
jgi:catechol 2,3-dioxygenase-like lactoylglutathione lyase family enzyme